jgi:LuxR family maltose regulon positive regulatory protein
VITGRISHIAAKGASAMPAHDVIGVLTAALENADPHRIATLVERHWLPLLRIDKSLVYRAVSAVPADVREDHPALILLSELPQAFAASVRRRTDPALRRLVAELDSIEDHRARLGAGLVGVISLNRRGWYLESTAFSRRLVETALQFLEPAPSDGIDLATLHLYAGATHLMAGDLPRADRYLAAAHRGQAPVANHAYDSAGKLAFLHALRGESHLASGWLERAHDLEPKADEWWLLRVEHHAVFAAHMLLAIDRLDWSDYHAHNRAADMFAPTETWAYVLYPRARAALFLGNQRGVIDELHDFRDLVADYFSSPGLPRLLFQTAEADLWMSLGEFDRARALIEEFGAHPMENATAARFHLLQGDPAAAEELAAESHWPSRITRRDRLTLLLLQVAADLKQRLHTDERARMLRQVLIETADEIEPWFFTLATAEPAVLDLLEQLAPASAGLVETLRKIDPPRPFATSEGPPRLTGRERLLLQQLSSSDPIPEIAQRLHVSPATIRNQRKSLYRKLGATSRLHALEIAERHGLIKRRRDPPD